MALFEHNIVSSNFLVHFSACVKGEINNSEETVQVNGAEAYSEFFKFE